MYDGYDRVFFSRRYFSCRSIHVSRLRDSPECRTTMKQTRNIVIVIGFSLICMSIMWGVRAVSLPSIQSAIQLTISIYTHALNKTAKLSEIHSFQLIFDRTEEYLESTTLFRSVVLSPMRARSLICLYLFILIVFCFYCRRRLLFTSVSHSSIFQLLCKQFYPASSSA